MNSIEELYRKIQEMDVEDDSIIEMELVDGTYVAILDNIPKQIKEINTYV